MTGPHGAAPEAAVLLTALEQRLSAAAAAATDLEVPVDVEPGHVAARLLPALLDACRPHERTDLRWLLLTVVHAAFPTEAEVRDLGRRLELAPTEAVESWLLGESLRRGGSGRRDLHATVVSGGTVVDVDFCARYETHTGIQRVVRETVPRWARDHELTLTAWVDTYDAMRSLAPREDARVLRHGQDVDIPLESELAYRPRLVVPWRSLVVLPDVPSTGTCDVLSALGRFSGNRVGMIGYDMIPITSAEQRPDVDAVASAQYLTVVKHAHRVAGISESATAEFAGFVRTLAAQGLRGPVVHEVVLTEDAPPPAVDEPAAADATASGRPVVLALGTREPHKNQRTLLHAAERLWFEGLDFEVRLVGGRGWSDTTLQPAIERLLADGRRLADVGRVSEDQLWRELRSADLVAFLSLHEGYGLPVAEALACGTPVLTASFGSQAEIARGGGCVTVDPRDDDAVTAALRELLTDRDRLARLAAEAEARPRRTWDDYATELWDFYTTTEDLH
ncbi:glycosyltransferase [Cellulomonas sp. GbtcB1]|uniref:glycosyltransferase n=1 Tax=Cellulomonas sp. GbtcB1 TaxID=2824746 RepID=UPI001C304EA1|nr:glycosyltransferase [Cellulomonas sp. GbtcB1]